METALLVAVIISAIGLLGTILPGVPGIPLMLVSIISYIVFDKVHHFSVSFIVTITSLALIGIASEYLLAYLGAKYFGASKYAVYGAIGGSIFGLIFLSLFLPPLGIFLGAMGGAVAGEYYFTKDIEKSIRAGWGTVLGLIGGSFFRFLIALTIFIMFISRVY